MLTRDRVPVLPFRRILYVDDEADIAMLARIALEQVAGLDVTVASSGVEAVQRLNSFHPDLILLDVMMPGMDGFATLAAIRRHPAGVSAPVVFITAATGLVGRGRRERDGVIGVIGKPFDPLSLPGLLRDLLAVRG